MGFYPPETCEVQVGTNPEGKAAAGTEFPEEELSLAHR